MFAEKTSRCGFTGRLQVNIEMSCWCSEDLLNTSGFMNTNMNRNCEKAEPSRPLELTTFC